MTIPAKDYRAWAAALEAELGTPLDHPDELRWALIETLRQLEGVIRSEAKLRRRLANVGQHVMGLIDHKHGVEKDVKRLEDVLAWIYRTESDIETVREVIQKEIPSRVKDRPT